MRKKHSSKLIDEIMNEVLRRLKEDAFWTKNIDDPEEVPAGELANVKGAKKLAPSTKTTSSKTKDKASPRPKSARKGSVYGVGGVHPLIGV